MFLNALLRANKAEQREVLSKGFASRMFLSREVEAQYCFDHLERYGKLPSSIVFRAQFTQFPSATPSEPLRYYADRMLERVMFQGLQQIMSKVSKKLRDGSIGAVQDCLKEMQSAEALQQYGASTDMDWRSWNPEDNYAQRELKGTLYVTPYRALNRMIRGVRPKQLISLAGRPAVSKTWIALLFAICFWEQDANILVISKEMGKEEMFERFDALYFGVDWNRFLSGKLTKAEVKALGVAHRELMHQRKNKFVVSDSEELEAQDVVSISAKIAEHQPDIVLVDGAYLLTDANGRSFVEKATNVSRALKRLARNRNVVLMQTLQMNRKAEEDGGSLETIAWADSIAQDSDVVMQVKGDRHDDHRELELLKARTMLATAGSFYIKAQFAPKVDLAELASATDKHRIQLDTIDGGS